MIVSVYDGVWASAHTVESFQWDVLKRREDTVLVDSKDHLSVRI